MTSRDNNTVGVSRTQSLATISPQSSSPRAGINAFPGVWRMRETRTDGSTLPLEEGKAGRRGGICRGRLSFKGFVGAGKGTVEYRGCGDREGKGRWVTKPKNIVNGRSVLMCAAGGDSGEHV